MKEKQQTPSQRRSNPVWLRQQIERLIARCDDDIKEDLERAGQTYGEMSQSYRASASSTRHWKKQLERILCGKTLQEDIAEDLERGGIHL